MTFIVTVVNRVGKEVPLRGTIWAYEMDRAQKFETREAAQAALDNTKKFMPAKIYKKAVIKEFPVVTELCPQSIWTRRANYPYRPISNNS